MITRLTTINNIIIIIPYPFISQEEENLELPHEFVGTLSGEAEKEGKLAAKNLGKTLSSSAEIPVPSKRQKK